MSKEDFISGTILEFKLPADLGYAYCKVLDFRHIRTFDGVIVKVYNYEVKTPLADINVLRNRDWLFGARRMPWLPGTRGKGAWKSRGVFIDKEDSVIPDFKYCIKSSPLEEEKFKNEQWDVVRNIDQYIPCSYENVKHLEDTIVSPRPAIERRTAMEYCRINNIDVENFFDLKNQLNSLIYSQMINTPIYNDIPKEIRGRALCENNYKATH